jgi:hypothetical protein
MAMQCVLTEQRVQALAPALAKEQLLVEQELAQVPVLVPAKEQLLVE